jgi:hypothetical protein
MPDPAAPVDTLSQVAASRAGHAVTQPIVQIVNDHGMRIGESPASRSLSIG